MSQSSALPLIGLPACRRVVENVFPFHGVGEKYLAAVVGGAGGLPTILPAMGLGGFDDAHFRTLVERLDGLLLTGSPSNIEPHHYAVEPFEGDRNDPHRDATTLPLIRAALAEGVPLLAICRGIQELNVALGGTLHPKVHELPGRLDHRSDKTVPHEERYALRHWVTLTGGGIVSRLAGGKREVRVNSLHGQAIDRVAGGLTVEAVAEDGTIEAVSVDDAQTFAIGVQWHAEWHYRDDPLSAALLGAFGDAARGRAAARGAEHRDMAESESGGAGAEPADAAE